jgi:hypothetical protein
MDLYKILNELYEERKRLGQIIKTLEDLYSGPERTPRKRGRKNMDAAARKAVSQRMKRYWAARREHSQQGSAIL